MPITIKPLGLTRNVRMIPDIINFRDSDITSNDDSDSIKIISYFSHDFRYNVKSLQCPRDHGEVRYEPITFSN